MNTISHISDKQRRIKPNMQNETTTSHTKEEFCAKTLGMNARTQLMAEYVTENEKMSEM